MVTIATAIPDQIVSKEEVVIEMGIRTVIVSAHVVQHNILNCINCSFLNTH